MPLMKYTSTSRFLAVVIIGAFCLGSVECGADQNLKSLRKEYQFDGTIPRLVLENYLSRSICVEGLLNEKGQLTDDTRMLTNTGAKYIARALCLWGAENNFLENLKKAKTAADQVLRADPEMLLEACVFEVVGTNVNHIAIPSWVFKDLDQPVETRNFRFDDMIYPVGQRRSMGRGQVPDVSRIETQLWFYYQAASYIDVGCEGIHFGQVEIMNRNDKANNHWFTLIGKVRAYASKHSRRHMVLCNGHVPTGGLMHNGNPILDFNSFPLRIKETPEKPYDATLEKGFTDSLFGRSKGGKTFSGWDCEHLPFIVELDNYGRSRHPGQPNVKGEFLWVWGYDEITWFGLQPREYRAKWLQYAWDWVRKTDPNGYLEMPGGRTASAAELRWYYANNPSDKLPTGRGDESAIRAVWDQDSASLKKMNHSSKAKFLFNPSTGKNFDIALEPSLSCQLCR